MNIKMLRNQLVVGSAVLSLGVLGTLGCAIANGENPEEQGAMSVSVASVRYGLSEISFLVDGTEEDGSPHIAVTEASPVNTSGSPIEQLVAKRATAMEIYQTLAGPNAVTPEPLRLSQAGQAARLGRTSAEVLSFTVDDTKIQKTTAGCNNWTVGDPISYQYWSVVFTPGLQSGMGSAGHPLFTVEPLAVGFCNESSATMSVTWSKYHQNADGTITTDASFTENRGTGHYRVWNVDGNSLPSRWLVSTPGNGSNQYLLRWAYGLTTRI